MKNFSEAIDNRWAQCNVDIRSLSVNRKNSERGVNQKTAIILEILQDQITLPGLVDLYLKFTFVIAGKIAVFRFISGFYYNDGKQEVKD